MGKIGKLFLLLVGLASVSVNTVQADNNLVVSDPWIREAPPNAPSLAGYMILENHADKKRTLISASASSFGVTMIHRNVYKDGMAHMVHMDKVDIAPKGKLVFEPNGYHLMLMKPNKSFKSGETVPIELGFSDGSLQKVLFVVRPHMKGGDMKKESGMKNHGKH